MISNNFISIVHTFFENYTIIAVEVAKEYILIVPNSKALRTHPSPNLVVPWNFSQM